MTSENTRRQVMSCIWLAYGFPRYPRYKNNWTNREGHPLRPPLTRPNELLRVRQRQTGVLRTNCFDSLDRTNLLQYQVPVGPEILLNFPPPPRERKPNMWQSNKLRGGGGIWIGCIFGENLDKFVFTLYDYSVLFKGHARSVSEVVIVASFFFNRCFLIGKDELWKNDMLAVEFLGFA